jgi:dTDP-4-amino-4,6-dideoxygalactose transaminase
LLIPYSKHIFGKEEEQAALNVLRSGWITGGPKIAEFEEAFKKYTGAQYAVAVSSGSAALILAIIAHDLASCRMIVSPLTYVATANAMEFVGGVPLFFDIDKDTWLLRDGNFAGTFGIIPTHYAGGVFQTKEDIRIIEDAAHACGSKVNDKQVGSKNTTCFSLHACKNLACGEGGMVTVEDKKIYEKIKACRENGVVKNGFYQDMKYLGSNFKMTDMQAAIGIEQLKKLDEANALRTKIYEKYKAELTGKVIFQKIADNVEPCHHIIPVLVEDQSRTLNFLKDNGIISAIHYRPVHLMSYYQKKYGYQKGNYPNAEYVGGHVIALPCYPGLTEEEQDFVISKVKETV